MAIEDMIGRIIEEAEVEKQRILTEARSEAERIRVGSRKKVDAEISEMESRLTKEIEQTMNVSLSDGKRKAREALLSAKEELIWDAMSAVRERIKHLSDDELGSYLHLMLSRTLGMLGDDAVVYAVGDRDLKVLSNERTMVRVLEGHLMDREPFSRFKGKELLGGFIAADRKGSMVVDMTFQGLMDRNEERIRETIAEHLFQNM
ncbi:MAG: V-type ATP synthase subunit E [Candidatus Thermoplasmatota archaeon]|nr:V-type ATP synthase subunit E [Candidatus Thermoplasmatota archaeon]